MYSYSDRSFQIPNYNGKEIIRKLQESGDEDLYTSLLVEYFMRYNNYTSNHLNFAGLTFSYLNRYCQEFKRDVFKIRENRDQRDPFIVYLKSI